MPTTTLRPTSGGGPGGIGQFATDAWVAMSDSNDGTYGSAQVSPSEPIKTASGAMADLPTGAGTVTAVTAFLRGFRSSSPGDGCALHGGLNGAANINVSAPASVTEFSASVGGFTTAAQVNAATWYAAVADNGGAAGTEGRVAELWFDVTWNPVISGFKAFILSALPGMIGAGLSLTEMPRLARLIHARTGARVLPEEYLAAIRELREHRWPRHFVMA